MMLANGPRNDAVAALIDLADTVAAAADLDEAARRSVNNEREVGNPDWVICYAVLRSNTMLPAPLLQQIRDTVLALDLYSGLTKHLVLNALDGHHLGVRGFHPETPPSPPQLLLGQVATAAPAGFF